MKKGDRVRVLNIPRNSMPNLYGTPIDLTHLIGQIGAIEVSYTDGMHGIEFDDYQAWLIRKHTGVLFTEDDLEVIA